MYNAIDMYKGAYTNHAIVCVDTMQHVSSKKAHTARHTVINNNDRVSASITCSYKCTTNSQCGVTAL